MKPGTSELCMEKCQNFLNGHCKPDNDPSITEEVELMVDESARWCTHYMSLADGIQEQIFNGDNNGLVYMFNGAEADETIDYSDEVLCQGTSIRLNSSDNEIKAFAKKLASKINTEHLDYVFTFAKQMAKEQIPKVEKSDRLKHTVAIIVFDSDGYIEEVHTFKNVNKEELTNLMLKEFTNCNADILFNIGRSGEEASKFNYRKSLYDEKNLIANLACSFAINWHRQQVEF